MLQVSWGPLDTTSGCCMCPENTAHSLGTPLSTQSGHHGWQGSSCSLNSPNPTAASCRGDTADISRAEPRAGTDSQHEPVLRSHRQRQLFLGCLGFFWGHFLGVFFFFFFFLTEVYGYMQIRSLNDLHKRFAHQRLSVLTSHPPPMSPPQR